MFEKESQLMLLRKWVFIVFWILLVYHFYRYAWLAEDAFINMRVVRNFNEGFGLTWNPGERVQVFTSTLWMFVGILSSWVTGEHIYALLVISLLLVLATFWQLYRVSGGGVALFLAVAVSVLSSNSVRDYLSSGLETPLLMCLLAWFFGSLAQPDQPSFSRMCFIACLCMLARHDSILLTAPFLLCLAKSGYEKGGSASLVKMIFHALLSFSPVVAWTVFSIYYYGSPFPNTALAKIVSGLGAAGQALDYFAFIQYFDPLAYVFMASALVILYARKSVQFKPALWSMVLFVAYLFKVGADYMAGRFLVGPMVMLAFLLVGALRPSYERNFVRHGRSDRMIRLHASVIMFFGFVMLVRLLTAANAAQYHASRPAFVDGIVDERQVYFRSTDLETILSMGVDHAFRDNAETLRKHPGVKLVIACNIGMAAYFAPHDVYFVDPLALSDRFLAGLPPDKNSRIGHFLRPVPREYILSLVEGKNMFTDPIVRSYFDDVRLVARGDLGDSRRWPAIWRLLSNAYAPTLAAMDVNSAGGSIGIAQSKVVTPKSCHGAGISLMVPDLSSGQMGVRPLYMYDLSQAKH